MTIRALITNEKSPKVIRVIGKVKIEIIGLKKVLSTPRVIAKIIAVG